MSGLHLWFFLPSFSLQGSCNAHFLLFKEGQNSHLPSLHGSLTPPNDNILPSMVPSKDNVDDDAAPKDAFAANARGSPSELDLLNDLGTNLAEENADDMLPDLDTNSKFMRGNLMNWRTKSVISFRHFSFSIISLHAYIYQLANILCEFFSVFPAIAPNAYAFNVI